MSLNESHVENAALEWFGELGYAVRHGPRLAPGEPAAERESFGDVSLVRRVREVIRRLDPAIPEEARQEALRKVLRVAAPSLTQTNRASHWMLRETQLQELSSGKMIVADKIELESSNLNH
jgi:type I restriction enzyme R subunit